MILTGDYHTHTIYSHGKGTILENVTVAKEKGLQEIGISDHGFAHPVFGLSKRKLKKMKGECEAAAKETGVNVLLGIESNITGMDGAVDLKPKNYGYFDLFICGLHKFIMFQPATFIALSTPDIVCTYVHKEKVSKSLVDRNTKMYINVIKRNPVDAITHLNYCAYANAYEVAKAASDYGTYIELNSKKVHLTDEEIEAVLKTDVRFILSSDAHHKEKVGEIGMITETLKRVNFPLDRIDNIDGRTPNFRFKEYKKHL